MSEALSFSGQVFASSGGGKGPIPDMARDKLGWYNYWDEDNSGSLEKEEVVRALAKTLGLPHAARALDSHEPSRNLLGIPVGLSTSPARVQQMRSTVDAIWAVFDADGSQSIERDEFLRPGEGLADTIVATMQHG